MIGRLGVLVYDEDGRQQCHVCGRFWRGLGMHVTKHGLTADGYREEFGLLSSQPLAWLPARLQHSANSRRPAALERLASVRPSHFGGATRTGRRERPQQQLRPRPRRHQCSHPEEDRYIDKRNSLVCRTCRREARQKLHPLLSAAEFSEKQRRNSLRRLTPSRLRA